MDKNELARYQLSAHMLEEMYPILVQELASLTHETPEQVESIVDYICQTRPGRNKYIVVDDLLTFHRIATSESQGA